MTEGAQEADEFDALIGQTIAHKFKLLRLLGAGGMGAVFEAEDTLMRRRVALKIMRPEVARRQELVQRFVREARAANAIQHRNIVKIYDLARDEESGTFYIVQELLSGEGLSTRLERAGKLTPAEVMGIMGPVLDALHAAHEHGIIHRDIKPDNVFLHRGEDGTTVPKLIDFGISKIAEAEEGLAKTQTGTALGTPYYMSPEQVRGDSKIDARADVWSAAIMLFELLTGTKPFFADNYNILILKIMTERAPLVHEVEPTLNAEISRVLAEALAPDRDHRISSARTLRIRFEEAVTHESEGRDSFAVPLRSLSDRPLDSTQPDPRGAHREFLTQAARPSAVSPVADLAMHELVHSQTLLPAVSADRASVSPPRGLRWAAAGVALVLVGVGAFALRSNATPVASQTHPAAPAAAVTHAEPLPTLLPRPAPLVPPARVETPAPLAVVTAPPIAPSRGDRRGGRRGAPEVVPLQAPSGPTAPATAVVAAVTPPAAPSVEAPRPAPTPAPAPTPVAEPAAAATTPEAQPTPRNGGPRGFRFISTYPH
ncbi:MAG: serine/threonine-protein kinase [Deltaproteobacteria bacterium]|nr:serine/threonine-protein kinase [Deltaproteobacteria bacterium]